MKTENEKERKKERHFLTVRSSAWSRTVCHIMDSQVVKHPDDKSIGRLKAIHAKKKMQFMYTRRHTNDKHNRTTCPGFLAQWGYASVSFQKNVFFVCLFICLSVQQHKGNLMHFLVCYCKQPCWKQPKEKKRERVGQCWMIWLSLSSSPWMRLCLLHACVCVVFRHQRRRNYFYIYTADESVPLCFGSVLLCFW